MPVNQMYLVGWSYSRTLAGESYKIYTPSSVHITLEDAQAAAEFLKSWLAGCEEYQIDHSIQVSIGLLSSKSPVLPEMENVETWRREITSRHISKDTVDVEMVWTGTKTWAGFTKIK